MVPLEIINMVAEFTSPYNDGYTREGYKKKLVEIKDYINRVLGEGVGVLALRRKPEDVE